MIRYYKYRSEFLTPFSTSAGTLKYREGIVLAFQTESFTAFGEVAPLPGFSQESITQVLQVLLHNKKFLEQAFLNDDAEQVISVLDHIHKFPSLSFGLDTLLHDFRAKQKGISLGELLFQQKEVAVPCNAVIGSGTADEILTKTDEAVEAGFETIKLKVGVDFNIEKNAIEQIRERYPKLKIRVDANQAWTVQEAIQKLGMLLPFGIEYCEEPLASPTEENLHELKTSVPMKIAADESVRNIQQVGEITAKNLFDILIIKPALMGRFNNLNVTKQLADTHTKDMILTTSFDGGIGRMATAVFASGMGSRNLAHGLATQALLKEQVGSSKNVKKGVFLISELSGLGSPVDLTYLEEIKSSV